MASRGDTNGPTGSDMLALILLTLFFPRVREEKKKKRMNVLLVSSGFGSDPAANADSHDRHRCQRARNHAFLG